MHPTSSELRPSDLSVAPSAELRLRRHADFQAVYKVARKHYAKELSFFFAKRAQPEFLPPSGSVPASGPRVGLTVGKVMGKAHDRNRIKRRLREAVRRQAGILHGLPVDVVLHPRRSCISLEWASLESEIEQIFQSVRKLAHKPQTPSPPRKGKAPTGKPGKKLIKV